MRKKVLIATMLAAACLMMLSACGKKEPEYTGPVEETVQAVTIDQLEPGRFYVKSGNSYYALPFEHTSYAVPEKDPVKSKDGKPSGITDPNKPRYAEFVYKDTAIPSLYRNDQLVYVANGDIPSFTWERYRELGYSIGIYGLELVNSGKITATDASSIIPDSSIITAISQTENFPSGNIVLDSANGIKLGAANYGEGGIVTGMSKDSSASLELYVGTQMFPVTASVDTRYFKSFEVIHTDKYSLSADGYAIVEIPTYIRSGYYMLNNVGMVKYLNVDRGVDESSVNIDTPYYYEKDGKILTLYEWQEANGVQKEQEQQVADKFDVNNFTERVRLDLDQMQQKVTIDLDYKYISDNGYTYAQNTGQFPKAYIVNPVGDVFTMKETGKVKDDRGEEYTRLESVFENPLAGTWYLVYENLDNAYKLISQNVESGNSNTYVHNGESGNLTIWFDASSASRDLVITWENKDRALKDAAVQTPANNKYSKEKNPDMVVANEMGRFVMRIPAEEAGQYRIQLTGSQLGRVWVEMNDLEPAAPAPEEGQEAAPEGETSAEGESEAVEEVSEAAAQAEGAEAAEASENAEATAEGETAAPAETAE